MRKTVATFSDGDLATELLRDFRIESSVLCLSVMAAPWGFGVAEREAGSFHMLLDGQGWLEVDGLTEPISVRAGDFAVLPKGRAHWVKDSPTSAAPSLTSILDRHEAIDGELHFGGDVGPVTEIVCGVFAMEGVRSAPWIERLPAVVMSTGSSRSAAWRAAVAGALRDEARAPTRGGTAVVNRLLESLVADALRTELSNFVTDASAPGVALVDHRIGRVIGQLHDSPDAKWSVGALAGIAAMSRSSFAERFRSMVAEPPMRYLKGVRLRRAARLLRSTDGTIAEIATMVGYASEEALSRAFKGHFGVAPSAIRRQVEGYRAESGLR